MNTPLPAELRPPMRGTMRAWWDAAARGELRLARCATCASVAWPPRSRCPACGAGDIEWIRACGRGVVHTFTVVRQASDPYFKAKLPYVVAMIELAEGPRMMSNIVGCDVDAVRIGMPVVVTFVDVGDGLKLPMFEPAREAAR
jgi:uncharacterized OB-fold protein